MSFSVAAVKTQDDPLSLKKAIKAYRDEYLTGLTDEEKEKINEKIRAYLEKRNKENSSTYDAAALDAYIKSLLKEYGFKGNIDSYAAILGASAPTDSTDDNSSAPIQAASTISDNNPAAQGKATTQVIKEPDGSTYLLITTANNMRTKVKIGDGNNLLSENKNSWEANQAAAEYDRNIDDFFKKSDQASFNA